MVQSLTDNALITIRLDLTLMNNTTTVCSSARGYLARQVVWGINTEALMPAELEMNVEWNVTLGTMMLSPTSSPRCTVGTSHCPLLSWWPSGPSRPQSGRAGQTPPSSSSWRILTQSLHLSPSLLPNTNVALTYTVRVSAYRQSGRKQTLQLKIVGFKVLI